jgi:hypothetical protein
MAAAIRELAEAAAAAGQSIQDFTISIRCAGDCKDFKKNGVTWSEFRDGRVVVHTCEKELDPNG